MQFNVILKASALACAMLVYTACSESSSIDEQEPPSAGVPVRVSAVSLQDDGAMLYFAGVARSRQRATLSFQVGGVVSNRPVQIGQQVSQDQLLATLYNPQLAPAEAAAQARLMQLQSDFDQSQRELVRLERLSTRDLISIQSVEQQQALIESQSAAIDNAMASLQQSEGLNKESVLRAPFAGTIEAVLLEAGEYAQPGQAVMRLTGQGTTEVEIRVPPHMLDTLSVGDTVPVSASLSDAVLTGVVSEISASSTGNEALLAVVIALNDTQVRNAEALEVGIAREGEEQLSIPLGAVMRSAQGLSVFKVEDGRAARVLIEVDKILGERAFILPGALLEGDQVVYAGISRLAEGDALDVLQ